MGGIRIKTIFFITSIDKNMLNSLKVKRLENENKMLLDRNVACSDQNVLLISENADLKHELLLYKSLKEFLTKHPIKFDASKHSTASFILMFQDKAVLRSISDFHTIL